MLTRTCDRCGKEEGSSCDFIYLQNVTPGDKQNPVIIHLCDICSKEFTEWLEIKAT